MVLLRFFDRDFLRPLAWLTVALAASIGALPNAAAQEVPEILDPAEARRLAPIDPFPDTLTPAIAPTPYDKSEAERFRILRRSLAPEPLSEEDLVVRPLEGYIDWDQVEDVIYSPGRTRVQQGNFILEADKLIIDNRLGEIQAEGNVIMRTIGKDNEYGSDNEVHADALRYNFTEGEGIATNISGFYPPMYFKTERAGGDDDEEPSPMRMVSAEESLFRNTSVTACNFVIPHYRIRAREIILFANDRIFLRGATIFVGEVPIFYLPFYSRSVGGGSPWFYNIGTGSREGFRLRVGYEYEHETREPSFEDEEVFETRSRGEARVFADYLAKRGFGVGFQYKYNFDFDRHRGELQTYAINDGDREVGDVILDPNQGDEDEEQRWQFLLKHRTQITDDLYLIANIDMFSDPELFFDILDRFDTTLEDRERPIERRARIAVTYLREAYVMRLLFEAKDRIGIDRYSNYSDPTDNNLDFEIQPGATLEDRDANSISKSRWGRVTERAPEFTFATRYLPFQFRGKDLYLLSEIRAYNNLDKGLNIVDTDDDAWVRGIDIYHQVLWQHQLTERYILLAKLGFGLGVADRSDDDVGVDFSGVPVDLAGNFIVPTLRFTDTDGTFLVGTEEFNLADIEPFYAWVDAQVRLNARFSDALTGSASWSIRETTDLFIGDFYAQIGDRNSKADLFNYRIRQNWLRGNLIYRLVRPNLAIYGNAGINLQGSGGRYPNEELAYWNVGATWANRMATLIAWAGVGWSQWQVLHPSDSRAGEQDGTFVLGGVQYQPLHQRWFVKAEFSHSIIGGRELERSDIDEFTFFSDEDTRTDFRFSYGRELGPKWDTEFSTRYDSRTGGINDVEWVLQRDLHDALAVLRVRWNQNFLEADRRDDDRLGEFDVSLGVKLKLPDQDLDFGSGDVTTLRQRQREPLIAY